MRDFEEKEYKVFDMFNNQWALVTAGDIRQFNACTVSWGSLGNIWGRTGKSGSIITVYVHPARYTCEFLKENDMFTVSFFSPAYRKALAYIGSHSGRDEDKIKASGLTPIVMGTGVAYEEAELKFLCRKLYQHQFSKGDLAEDIQEYYAANPKAYPPDSNGDWQPHWVFMGEITDVLTAPR